jgi:hypothetical protein
LDVRSPWPLQLGLLLSAQYRFPFEIDPEPSGMRTQTFALRALPALAVPLGRSAAFGLGAGADITRIEPERGSDDRIRAAERRTLVLVAGPRWSASTCGRGLVGLMAVVAANESTRARFTLRGFMDATAEVIGEDRQLAIEGGELSDDFDGYGVHLYRIAH